MRPQFYTDGSISNEKQGLQQELIKHITQGTCSVPPALHGKVVFKKEENN